MRCASVFGATSARRRKHDLVGGFQGRRQRRDGAPQLYCAGDRRFRPALRSLAQSGAPRRHARLPPHRARFPRLGHPPGRRAGEAPLGGSQPEGRAGARHGRLGHVRSPAMSVKIDLNHKIHVLTKKEELDGVRVPGKVVVVLDILFATTTMVTALAHGATEVIPVLDEAAARAESQRYRECVVAGELYAETIAGFAHPAPLALLKHGIRGKTVVYSTTNGTVAMTRAAGAARVYCGALLNARRLAEHIVARHPRETVLLVCSGSGDNFNFEDFYGAGYFVERFADLLGAAADLSDAAKAALALYRHARAPDALLDCRIGRMMAARGLREEVEFACRFDALPVVPALDQGRLRLVSGSARSRSG